MDIPLYLKVWPKETHTAFNNTDFQSIFARKASAVTPSEINSINTNKKSTMGFPMSLR